MPDMLQFPYMKISIQLTPMLALILRRQAVTMNISTNDLIEEALRYYLIRRQTGTPPVILAAPPNERVIQF